MNSLVLKVTVLTLLHILEATENWVILGKCWFLRKGRGSVVVQRAGKEVLTTAHLQEGQKDTRPELVIPSAGAEVLALLCFKLSVCASLQSSFGEQHSRQVRNCRQTQERVRPLTPPRPQEGTP